MVDLFGMVLSGAVSWGVAKSLDVLVECPRCAERDKARIANVEVNRIQCRNCQLGTGQFTNACEFTVDRQTGRIGHAMASASAKPWAGHCPGESRFPSTSAHSRSEGDLSLFRPP